MSSTDSITKESNKLTNTKTIYLHEMTVDRLPETRKITSSHKGSFLKNTKQSLLGKSPKKTQSKPNSPKSNVSLKVNNAFKKECVTRQASKIKISAIKEDCEVTDSDNHAEDSRSHNEMEEKGMIRASTEFSGKL